MLSELNFEMQPPDTAEPNRWSGTPGVPPTSLFECLRAGVAELLRGSARPGTKRSTDFPDIPGSPRGERSDSDQAAQAHVRDESFSSPSSLTIPVFPAGGKADEGRSPQRGESSLEASLPLRIFHL